MVNDVKVLKLITGEEVLARISDDLSNGDGLIILNKPMTLQAVPGQGGQVGFALVPLFMSGKNENITIGRRWNGSEGISALDHGWKK